MKKNFYKVFRFTFKNQVSPKGYKMLTGIVALVLFVLPVVVFLIMGNLNDDEQELSTCGADVIYVVNPQVPDADFNMLNSLGVEGYTDIRYVNAETVEEALDSIREKQESASFVLQIDRIDDRLYTRIILPDTATEIEDKADNYEKFMAETESTFMIIASGISIQDLNQIMLQSDSSVYSQEGYQTGKDLYSDEAKVYEQQNEEIRPIFNICLIFVTVFIVYMVIILYCTSIMQSVIEEKTSKLMDTMLISVEPKSLVFGKMLGILTSGLLQLFLWIASLTGGVFVGIKVADSLFGEGNIAIITFIKSFGELELFEPVNVVLGILALIFGIVLYASLATMCGAISSSREEAASNQSIFMILLVLSFYLVLFKGISATEVQNVLYLFPFSSAMLLPAGACLGIVSKGVAAAGLALTVACVAVFIVLAGKLYTMMSLYKGNKVSLGKALKMLFKSAQ